MHDTASFVEERQMEKTSFDYIGSSYTKHDDDNNLSVGNRNHLKLGIEPESWLQSHELGF